MARDPIDELMNMRVIYGSPPEPSVINFDKLGPCVHCGQLASKHGGKGDVANVLALGWCPDGKGGWGYDRFEAKPVEGAEELLEMFEREMIRKEEDRSLWERGVEPPRRSPVEGCLHCKAALAPPYRPCDAHGTKVDAPPSYASSDEIRAIQALEGLDDVARSRVLRYAISRWALHGLGTKTD